MAYFTASCDPYEGEKGNKAFAESLKLDYPILSDPDRKVAMQYGVASDEKAFAKRWTFYIDKEGVIKHIDKEVGKTIKEHGKEIAKKLEELGIPKK